MAERSGVLLRDDRHLDSWTVSKLKGVLGVAYSDLMAAEGSRNVACNVETGYGLMAGSKIVFLRSHWLRPPSLTRRGRSKSGGETMLRKLRRGSVGRK